MDLKSWKSQIQEHLSKSGNFIRSMTPGVLYGSLATATILPLVMAVKSDDGSALIALQGLLSGIGLNLVTNQIQEWKDQDGDKLKKDLPKTLALQAAQNAEWKDALDELLTALETPRIVQAIISEADRDWFVDALRTELRTLGSKIEIQIVAPGVLAPHHLRADYLNRLYIQSNTLSLTGVDHSAASGEAQLNLSAIYTALSTLTLDQTDGLNALHPVHVQERLSALEQLNQHRCLVLLGEPGSGKSSFINFLSLCFAGAGLGKEDVNLSLLTKTQDETSIKEYSYTGELTNSTPLGKQQMWQHGALLPVRIILRDFAAYNSFKLKRRATADDIWKFICDYLLGEMLADYEIYLRNELQEQGGLILFDGLDEVPDAEYWRTRIKEAIEDFVAIFPRCRFVVTSRTYAYQQQGWRLLDFTEAVLAPFSEQQIRYFIDKWYAHIAEVRLLNRKDAQGRAALLKHAIFANARLHELAERPLLLTLTASLHAWHNGSLPDRREKLYDVAVELLLDRWENQRVVHDESGKRLIAQPSLVEWLKVDREAVRRVLNQLAYAAHAGQPVLEGTADIPEKDLVYALFDLRQNPDVSMEKLIVYLSERAGLLIPRGVKVYAFPHRTFQEYLAACYLTDNDYPDRLAELVRQEPNRWREVALLAGAKAARGANFAIWSLVDALCFREPNDLAYTVEDMWGAHLAGQALVESADLSQVKPRNQKRIELVRQSLLHLLNRTKIHPEFPDLERSICGKTLGLLDDPRPGVGLKNNLPHIKWSKQIEAGKFFMGSKEEEAEIWDGTPQFTCNLLMDNYKISIYPITTIQYKKFIDDDGYQQEKYWTAAGWAWRCENMITGPESSIKTLPFPNYPQVGVSWFEAVAFCNWLSTKLRLRVTLPTEAQWERAARGVDGRRYPWGSDEEVSKYCNVASTRIGSVVSVGLFTKGKSICGAFDMAGNILEWCSTKWLDNYIDYEEMVDDDLTGILSRIVRGGSYRNQKNFANCAFRLRNEPYYRDANLGFRIATKIA